MIKGGQGMNTKYDLSVAYTGGNVISGFIQDHDLNRLAELWLATADVKQRTKDTYRKAIKPYLEYIRAKGICNPARVDIIAYREALKGRGLAAGTITLYIQAVKRLHSWIATESGGRITDIAAKVKGAKMIKGFKKDYLSAANVSKLIQAAGGKGKQSLRDTALIYTMVTTGIRTIEAQRANVSDIQTVGGDTVLYIQGKGRDAKDAYVKLAPVVAKAIQASLAERAGRGETITGDTPVFASNSNHNRGGRLAIGSISRIVKQALRNAGMDSTRLTAHSLRHTAATLNLLAGATLAETQQLLRHSNINTTMIYSHAIEREKNNSELRIAAVIAAAQ